MSWVRAVGVDGRMAGEGRCSCRCIQPPPALEPARPLPPPAAPAHCQVQCQGHARASAAARRNAGAAGGRRPASRQCFTDNRATHRIAISTLDAPQRIT
ncbi:unnamed protein product [Arctia plantaginis]|uniref:Uncharacterized protein n=1 Tax=Arctia plantaginis TaxID=874455 RepID=A0A8S1AMD7_ARCPL|nr:unnamed protein product [Arctia plantaginis]